MTSRPLRLSAPVIRLLLTAVGVLAVIALGTLPPREHLYSAIAGAFSDSNGLGVLVGAIASRGLLILVAVAAAVAARSWMRDRAALWQLATGGVAVVGAYLLSEAVKMVVTEERPCRAMVLDTVLTCPDGGDWSWPSNHSVIAAAFASACIVALPSVAWFAALVAIIIALSRVAAGVHYVHDVASGLALGIAVVVVVTVALQPAVDRIRNSLLYRRNTTSRRP